MRWAVRFLALLVPLLVAASAHAGSYVVRACDTSAGHVPNHSWEVAQAQWYPAGGGCANPGERFEAFMWPNQLSAPPGTGSTLTFAAPEGATIADFRFNREVYYYNPTASADTKPPYILYELGATPFAGAGEYPAAVRDAINAAKPSHWYGYPTGAAPAGPEWIGMRDYPVLRGYDGRARTLRVTVGCSFGGAACSLRNDGSVVTRIFGAEVRVADATPPSVFDVQITPQGARFSARDNVGVARAQLVDVTDPAAPTVLVDEDYTAVVSDAGARCDFTYVRPCPDLSAETIVGQIPSGRRRVVVRIVDAAGNVGDSPPSTQQVGSPATSCLAGGARLLLRKRAGDVGFGRSTRVSGRVLAADGTTPVAGAPVQVYTRVLRRGSGWRPGRSAATGARGRYRIRLPEGPSRAVRVVHREGGAIRCSPVRRLRVRAGVSLRTDRSVVSRGGRISFSGRLRGGPARGGRLVIVQAFDGGRWRTFASARTGKRGRWATSYRFSGAASGSFRFRAVVRSQAGYPYASGTSRVRLVHVG
jgi:hypothetical protein